MVHDTCNNDPAPEQQSKHQQASTENHVTKELRDTDALKKNIKRYFTVITSTTFQQKQTKRLR